MFHVERDGHHSHYTCITNKVVMDNRLSLAARGFFAVVLSLSDNWDFSVNGMARLVGVNKDTVLRYIRELEEHGYVRIGSKDEIGRYARKSYIFYESPAGNNTSPYCEVTENTSPKDSAPKISVPKNTARSSINISNTEYKQSNIQNDRGDRQEETCFLEKQINADHLRVEYGTEYIDRVIEVIVGCMKAKSRTINGGSVDNPELVRVFGKVSEEDIRKAVGAVRGKKFSSFSGYFGNVLFNQIRNRLDEIHPTVGGSYSSIDYDEVERNIMAKYLNCGG